MNKSQEALELSRQIIDSIELSNGNLQDLLFKALRVCRLIKDEKGIKIFTYETCGYARDTNGKLTSESSDILKQVGRIYFTKIENKDITCFESRLIGELLDEKNILTERMKVASDPQSYGDNMTLHMIGFAKNTQERNLINKKINHDNNFINTVKGYLYNYMLNIYNALNYGEITENIFQNIRETVDNKIATYCPENTKKFFSVYDNLLSENSEDWANAVHSCRRIIIELANKLYPPQNEHIIKSGKTINLKEENYINRLIQYIDTKSTSETYGKIVGSELNYIGQVLDSIINGLNKGTHAGYSKMEAERVVVYTYLLIGDILNL